MLFCPARATGCGVAVVYRLLKEFGIKNAPILHALRVSRLRNGAGAREIFAG